METKNIKDVCGIYAIVNIKTHKKYIGSSISTKKRWLAHRLALRKGIHHSCYLQRAWNKHGEESFIFVILEECSEQELISREQFYIDHLSDYNTSPTAGNCSGVKHSIATKTKQSLRMQKIMRERPEFVTHITTLSKGRPKSYEWKMKMSKRLKGVAKKDDHVTMMAKARAELSVDQVFEICELRKSGMTIKKICKTKGLGFCSVQRLLDGKSYRWIEGIPSIDELASWKLGKSRRGDQATYNFFHEIHGKMECTKKELISEFPNVNRDVLSKVCRGVRKSIAGWKLIK